MVIIMMILIMITIIVIIIVRALQLHVSAIEKVQNQQRQRLLTAVHSCNSREAQTIEKLRKHARVSLLWEYKLDNRDAMCVAMYVCTSKVRKVRRCSRKGLKRRNAYIINKFVEITVSTAHEDPPSHTKESVSRERDCSGICIITLYGTVYCIS